jgi:tagatose-1,6-bisphosphate aldolase
LFIPLKICRIVEITDERQLSDKGKDLMKLLIQHISVHDIKICENNLMLVLKFISNLFANESLEPILKMVSCKLSQKENENESEITNKTRERE